MEAILIALKEENKEASRLLGKYNKEMGKLPKGSFFVRKLGKKLYGYLTYSVKGVIKQDYLGAMNDKKIKEYRELMARKKKLRELMAKAKNQHIFLERALRYAGKKS